MSPSLRYLLVVLSVFSALLGSAQVSKEANIWYFGDQAGLDFNGGAPVALTNSVMVQQEGSASIADANGNLLFYTNGMEIWNKNHVYMTNGTGLLGNMSSSQSAVVVKQPGQSSIYYVFTVDVQCASNGLQYSIVDMQLQGGLGEVTVKNVFLFATSVEKVTAVSHANGLDFWVISHDCGGTNYYAYLLSSTGVSGPTISNVGQTQPYTGIGYMKASPQGDRIVSALHTINVLEVASFDDATGSVSAPFTIAIPGASGPYGVEFSPSGQFLYVSNEISRDLYQLDMLAGTPAQVEASAVLITTVSNFGGALQLAPDGKIYYAEYMTGYLHAINDPDQQGAACNFAANQVYLAGKTNRIGLPDFVQSLFSATPFTHEFICFGDSTHFVLSDSSNVDSLHWNFDDPASGPLNFASGFTAYHQFTAPGTYDVTAIYFNSATTDTVTSTVVIHPLPLVDAGPDLDFCEGDNATLSATGAATYTWEPGGLSGSPVTVAPSTETTYTVTGTSANGCVDTDEVVVTPYALPQVDAGPDKNMCDGDFITLTATGAVTYVWQPGGLTIDPITVSPTSTTVYTVTGVDAHGCENSDEVTLFVNGLPSVTADSGITCPGFPIVLHASGATTYMWVPGGLTGDSVTVAPLVVTSYTVTGTDINGCEQTATALVDIKDTCATWVFLPNAFSPNGDGHNDLFLIFTSNFTLNSFSIYSRLGERIFETSDVNQGWDGTFRGREQPVGSFAVMVTGTDRYGEHMVESGNVTLLR